MKVNEDYDWKMNRYQKANWGDAEAKEAHASVVKYLWRKEYELCKEIDQLKKQIAKQQTIQSSEKSDSASSISNVATSTKRDVETAMRGIHFRTLEDKVFDKISLLKSERKLADNLAYIEKHRSKANTPADDDISDELKNSIRGRSAYQIALAILDEADKAARLAKRRQLENSLKQKRQRGIYEIMADRNRLGIQPSRPHQPLDERTLHGEHDSRWNHSDYLNLVGYRMQNDTDRGFKVQNHNEIDW